MAGEQGRCIEDDSRTNEGRGVGALRRSWLARRGGTGLGQKSFGVRHTHVAINVHGVVGCLLPLRPPAVMETSESQRPTVMMAMISQETEENAH